MCSFYPKGKKARVGVGSQTLDAIRDQPVSVQLTEFYCDALREPPRFDDLGNRSDAVEACPAQQERPENPNAPNQRRQCGQLKPQIRRLWQLRGNVNQALRKSTNV